MGYVSKQVAKSKNSIISCSSSSAPFLDISEEDEQPLSLFGDSSEKKNTAKRIAQQRPAEVEEGNVEHKWKLVSPSPERIQHLITQLNWRLGEGNGECIYEIGYEDNGNPKGISEEEMQMSLATIHKMCEALGANYSVLRREQGKEGQVCEVLVRKFVSGTYTEIRVAVVGNVDSGKSTLVGVLTRGSLDNGRGAARTCVFKHLHEMQNGRTSAVSTQVMGFDSMGKVVNYRGGGREMSWQEITQESSRVVTLFDLCGHERYIKTTIFGLSALLPHIAIVVVGANMGVTRMTREHIGLALGLKIPIVFCVTKVDICPPNVLDETMEDIMKILRSPGVRKFPQIISNQKGLMDTVKNFISADFRICPIFLISSVTGGNYDLLRMFLNLVPMTKKRAVVGMDSFLPSASSARSVKMVDEVCHQQQQHLDDEDEMTFAASSQISAPVSSSSSSSSAIVIIDEIFQVAGVGVVVSGIILAGVINIGQKLWIGPDGNGNFTLVSVKSMHNKRVPVRQVTQGQFGTFSLPKIKNRKLVRKGQVLLDASHSSSPQSAPCACLVFECEVVIFHHPTSILVNYQPMVQVLNVRQSAKVLRIEKKNVGGATGSAGDVIRTGDRCVITFQFLFRPEFLILGSRLIFREGRTRGMGNVTAVHFLDGKVSRLGDDEVVPQPAMSSEREKENVNVVNQVQKTAVAAAPEIATEVKKMADDIRGTEDEQEQVAAIAPMIEADGDWKRRASAAAKNHRSNYWKGHSNNNNNKAATTTSSSSSTIATAATTVPSQPAKGAKGSSVRQRK